MKQFNYILNDLALLSLAARCLYSESATHRDRDALYEQLQLLIAENTKLRHLDYNKDTCNSRQRIANKNIYKCLRDYKEYSLWLEEEIDGLLKYTNNKEKEWMLVDTVKELNKCIKKTNVLDTLDKKAEEFVIKGEDDEESKGIFEE